MSKLFNYPLPAAVVAAGLALCAPTPSTTPPPAPTCASCHAYGGTGLNPGGTATR